MVVCICRNINEKNLIEIIKTNQIKKVKEVQKLQICDCCKKCCLEVKQIIKQVKHG